MKRPKSFSPSCDHTIVRKMKGPRLDVDAICAAMLEGYEKNRLLWAAKQQQLEAMGPSTDETSRNKKKKKKNETTKKKMKKNKNKSFKRPLDFPF